MYQDPPEIITFIHEFLFYAPAESLPVITPAFREALSKAGVYLRPSLKIAEIFVKKGVVGKMETYGLDEDEIYLVKEEF